MLSGDLESRLACPVCRERLWRARGGLACAGCGGRFPIRDGVPDLLPWPGGAPGWRWRRWRRRLDRLQEWRRRTWDGSAAAAARGAEAREIAAAFFAFLDLPPGGRILDIGCGGGDLRRFLRCHEYWGLDPLADRPPQPGAAFLRGVGECVPLADASVDAVILCETLDHCQEPRRVLDEVRRVLVMGGLVGVLQSSPGPPRRISPWRRARVAAGRLRRRLRGRPAADDAATKVRPLQEGEILGLVSSRVAVERWRRHGAAVFVRGRRSVAPEGAVR